MIVSKFNKLPLKWRWAITFLASFSLSLTLCAISYGIYLGIMGTTHEDQPSTKPGNDNSTTERPDGGSGHLKIVSRTQWNAQPAMNVTPLTLPSKYIIIAHTGGNPCSSLQNCSQKVKTIQYDQMMLQKMDDISYNFLVGGDGYGYEGRGWAIEGQHSQGFNAKSICIAFIGIFTDVVPPEQQLVAAKKLIERGVKLGQVIADYKLLGHCQVKATLSPGQALYRIIRTWDHWSADTGL